MAKYRKKPVVIEAELYKEGLEDGFDCFAYRSWKITKCEFSCGNGKDYRDECKKENRARPYINTLEGKHYITPTDYIITGVKGERYPCDKDIFEMIYEEVKADE